MRNSEAVVGEIQKELRRTPELQYAHRLHGILLVAQGLPYRSAAELLGDAPRTLAYWLLRYQEKGLVGLLEPAPVGRPPRLTLSQVTEITGILR